MLNKKISLQLYILAVLSFFNTAFGQDKIHWEFKYDNSRKMLEMKAEIAEGWHLYSQHVANQIGPVPTQFTFEPVEGINLIGVVVEPTPIQKYDENFEAMLDFFEGKVVFTQRVSTEKSGELKGKVTYMVCNDTMCLPPTDQEFIITIKH